MITAFQSNAFQSNPLAFQIASGPPAPTPDYEDVGAGYLANPNDLLAYRQAMEERQKVEDARVADRADLRRFVSKAFGIEEPEPEADLEQVAERAVALAEFDGRAATIEIMRELVAEERARLLAQQAEDDIMMILLLSA